MSTEKIVVYDPFSGICMATNKSALDLINSQIKHGFYKTYGELFYVLGLEYPRGAEDLPVDNSNLLKEVAMKN